MAVEKNMASSSLVEVVDRILDKGVVVDTYEGYPDPCIDDYALKYAEAIGLTATA